MEQLTKTEIAYLQQILADVWMCTKISELVTAQQRIYKKLSDMKEGLKEE